MARATARLAVTLLAARGHDGRRTRGRLRAGRREDSAQPMDGGLTQIWRQRTPRLILALRPARRPLRRGAKTEEPRTDLPAHPRLLARRAISRLPNVK